MKPTVTTAVLSLALFLSGCVTREHSETTPPSTALKPGALPPPIPDLATNTGTIRAARNSQGQTTITLITETGEQPAGPGDKFQEGATLRTDARTTADLFIGDNGPVIRLKPSATLKFVRLRCGKINGETVFETMLDLERGQILGNVRKMAAASRYEVRTPMGVAGIRDSEYNLDAQGRLNTPQPQPDFTSKPQRPYY